MTNSGDARNKLSIINCLLYNICATKELTCLWTYFLSAVERVNKMWDLHSFLVGMLTYDSLKSINRFKYFIYPGIFIETTVHKILENFL